MEDHDRLYHFFIKRLKKKKKELDVLYDLKRNAPGVAQEREYFMQITKQEAKITELREIFHFFGLFPKSVKEKIEA